MTVLEGHTCEPARLQHPGLRAGTTAMTLVWLHVAGQEPCWIHGLDSCTGRPGMALCLKTKKDIT